jgi:hypothetical protein
MISALLFEALLPPIDFSCPPTCLAELRPQIELLAKQPVVIAPELRNEVLVVRATDVEADDILDQIAYAVCARWTRDDLARLHLEPDPEAEAERVKEYEGYAGAAFDRVIAENLKRAESFGIHEKSPSDLAAMIAHEMNDTSFPFHLAPSTYGMWKILESIGGIRLARDSHGYRRVHFSASPFAGEESIPDSGKHHADIAFTRTRQTLHQLQSHGFTPEDTQWTSFDQVAFNRVAPTLPDADWSPYVEWSSFYVSLEWRCAQGRLDAGGSEALAPLAQEQFDLPASLSNTFSAPRIDDLHDEFRTRLSAETMERLQQGEINACLPQTELLSWPQIENAILTESPDRDFCLLLPDSVAWLASTDGQWRAPVWQYLNAGCQLSERDSWVVGAAALPSQIREQRFDRDAMAWLIRMIDHGRGPTAEELINSDARMKAWMTLEAMTLSPLTSPLFYGDLSMLATFTANHRKILTNGGTLRIADLTVSEKQLLFDQQDEDFSWERRKIDGSWPAPNELPAFNHAPHLAEKDWRGLRVSVVELPSNPTTLVLQPDTGEGVFGLANAQFAPSLTPIREGRGRAWVIYGQLTEDTRLRLFSSHFDLSWPSKLPKRGRDSSLKLSHRLTLEIRG